MFFHSCVNVYQRVPMLCSPRLDCISGHQPWQAISPFSSVIFPLETSFFSGISRPWHLPAWQTRSNIRISCLDPKPGVYSKYPGHWNVREWFKQCGDSDRFPQRNSRHRTRFHQIKPNACPWTGKVSVSARSVCSYHVGPSRYVGWFITTVAIGFVLDIL